MNRARELAIQAGLAFVERHRLQTAESLARSETNRVRKTSIKQSSVPMRLPHPIPYQGSKRNLSRLIGGFVPRTIGTWYEPFVGSAAMTLWAAHKGVAKRYVIADSLEPIANLWRDLIDHPNEIAGRYEQIWLGQTTAGPDYFNKVRDRYNASKDAVDLLYLICRCVKNAVRFDRQGRFTQSVDKRRLGMHPDKMRAALFGASMILRGKTEVRVGDWLDTTADATCADFCYLDPPYLGTTVGRDKRYAAQLPRERLIQGLALFRDRKISFALSYDGMTGERRYGPPLPEELGLTRLLLHAGTSSQATLVGRREDTVESLYLTPDLVGNEQPPIIKAPKAIQESLAI
jgi:DNA adenine methylase